MKEYYEYKKKCSEIEEHFKKCLNQLLEKHNFISTDCWLSFEKDGLLLVWNNGKLPRFMLDELEEQFGKISCIYTNHISSHLFIKFEIEE